MQEETVNSSSNYTTILPCFAAFCGECAIFLNFGELVR